MSARITEFLSFNNQPKIAKEKMMDGISIKTLWGISKKYKVSVEDLKKANPSLKTEGLKIGKQIVIPSNGNSVVQQPIENVPSELVEVSREVMPKETKYAIAKKY